MQQETSITNQDFNEEFVEDKLLTETSDFFLESSKKAKNIRYNKAGLPVFIPQK